MRNNKLNSYFIKCLKILTSHLDRTPKCIQYKHFVGQKYLTILHDLTSFITDCCLALFKEQKYETFAGR